jgi:pilus assembly protein TadC
VAAAWPAHTELARAVRIATISGLTNSVAVAGGEMRSVLSQLARAQRSGAPLADTVRAMIEADISAEKARRMARARTLPVRLMIPLTLLLLPGLVLLFYAPSMLRLFDELSGPLT